MTNLFCDDNKKILPTLKDKSIDLVLTDPPYFYNKLIRKKYDSRSDMDDKFQGLYTDLIGIKSNENINYEWYLNEFKRLLKKMNVLIWCNKNQLNNYITWIEKNNYKWELLIWEKTNPLPIINAYYNDKEYCFYIYEDYSKCYGNDKYNKKTIYHYPIGQDRTGHPTTKPIKLIKNQILKHSQENEIVLDCFLGSGTTAVACQSLNRKWIGVEINKKYYEICRKRLQFVQMEILF